MSRTDRVYASIVSALEQAGHGTPYVADANEPDPRYKGYGVRAEGKRRVFLDHRDAIRELDEPQQLDLARRLVESRYGEQQSIALSVLEPLAAHFTPARLKELDALVRCLHGWSKVDAFTGSLLPAVLERHPAALLKLAGKWSRAQDRWLRRASVVLFTRKVAREGKHNDTAFEHCERLRFDPEEHVLKGVSWALKDMRKSDEARVRDYLAKLEEEGVSKLLIRYARR